MSPSQSLSATSLGGSKFLPRFTADEDFLNSLSDSPPRRGGEWFSDALGRRFDGDIEMDGIHDSIPLELRPNAVRARTRKGQIELDLRGAVCNERVRMHHVDQIVTGCQHMAPSSKISLQTIARRNAEAQLRVLPRDGLKREG